jgi:hypothetical protein
VTEIQWAPQKVVKKEFWMAGDWVAQ